MVKTEAVVKDEPAAAVDTSQICTICGKEVAEAGFWKHVLERHGLMAEEYQTVADTLQSSYQQTVADTLKSPKLAGNVDEAEKVNKVRKYMF